MSRGISALVFALMGAFALAAQTALFREYLVVYEGNELGAGIFFASWLFWVGAGALVALRIAKKDRWFPGALALYPIALLLQLILIRSLRSIAGVAPTDLFPAGTLFLVTFLTNSPVSFITGALFPLAVGFARRTTGEQGQAAGVVYIFECLGAGLGAAAVTAFLLLGRGALPALPMLCALLCGGGLAVSFRIRQRPAAIAHAALLVASLALLVTPLGTVLEDHLARIQWRSLYTSATPLARVETPYRRIETARIGTQTIAVQNGSIFAVWPSEDAAVMDAALLLTQPGRPDRILLIGAGADTLAVEMLRYPVKEIVRFLPDPAGHEFLLAAMPAAERAALTGNRVRFVAGTLADLGEEAPFDLVVVAVGDPDTALTARYFTTGFYARMKDRLGPEGVFATAITSAENYFGTELTRYGSSVLATLGTVFPEVKITPGERAWFLAGRSEGMVSTDAEILADRLEILDPGASRLEPERMHLLLEPRRVRFVEEIYGGLPEEERRELVSTRERPQTFFLNLLVAARMEGRSLTGVLLAIRDAGAMIFLWPLLAILLMRLRYAAARPESVRTRRFAGGYLLAVIGAASIGIDVVLLLHYQQRFGLLFLKVGLANALFMFGLTAGGLVGMVLSRGRGDAAVRAGLSGFVAALAILLLPMLAVRISTESAFLALFFAGGLFLGPPFPLAAALLRSGGTAEARTGGILEAADHFGGAVGAALAGVLLVPLYGVLAAANLLALAVLTAPLLLFLERVVERGFLDRLLPSWTRRIRSRLTTFPMVGTAFVLLAVVVAAAAISLPVRRELDRPITRLDPARLRASVAADRFLEVESPFVHYDGWKEGGTAPVNHTLATQAAIDGPDGFAGPLNLLLSVKRDGTIGRVALIESKETPAYIRDLPAFLDLFAGRDAGLTFQLVEEGSAKGPADLARITGATITCQAAVKTVNRAKERVLVDLMGREAPPAAASATAMTPEVIAVLVFFLLAVPVYLRGGRRLRIAFLVLVLLVLGFAYNLQLSAGRVVDLIALGLPPLGNLPVFLLTVLAVLFAVLFGPVYCGLLCPFGAAQELLSRLGLTRQVSPEVDRKARFTKHVVLAVTAVAVLLLGSKRILDYDPLAVVFSLKADTLLWVLIAAVLLLSLFYFRFWCRYLCPVGAFLSLGNRVALLAGRARKKDYRRCDLGVRSKIDMDCLHCNRCLEKEASG